MKQEALRKIAAMSDAEFTEFFGKIPPRVQMLIRGKIVNWQEVLPEWYIAFHYHEAH